MKNCVICKEPVEIAAPVRYQYKECGLDNVWIGGVELRRCACGESLAIRNISGLHRAIARRVAVLPRFLSDKEFLFLAKYLEYSNDGKATYRHGYSNYYVVSVLGRILQSMPHGAKCATGLVLRIVGLLSSGDESSWKHEVRVYS